jgi:hypothetical protein
MIKILYAIIALIGVNVENVSFKFQIIKIKIKECK